HNSSDNGKSSTRGSHPSNRSSPTPHYSPRRSSSTHQVVSPSPAIISSSLRRRVAGKELRPPKSWKLIPPSEGWMYEGDEEEKEIGGMEPSIEKEEASEKEEEEEDSEEEEDPEEESPATPLLMDVDADEDYLQYLEELQHYPGYSPIHSGHTSVQNSSGDSLDRHSNRHGTPSYDLFGVWPPPSSGPSL
ncbi:hypothetical protein PIB30_082882, partial [Stylosanthes scabra]|nr:hypothetical protein [Stylosanthes scabra]